MSARIEAKTAGRAKAIPSRWEWLKVAAKAARRHAGNELASGDWERTEAATLATYLEDQLSLVSEIYGEAAKFRALETGRGES